MISKTSLKVAEILLVSLFVFVFNVEPFTLEITSVVIPYNYPELHYAIIATNPNTIKQSVDWWSMHRHDLQHSGYSMSKAPNTNQTLWTAQFKDWVISSPTVHNNLVFIGSDENLDGGWGAMRAFNAITGQSAWNYTTGGDVESTAAVAYGRVYFGSNDKKLYCIDETSGSYQWHFTTNGQVISSPCVTENRVVFGSEDGKLYCLDALTGVIIWNFSTGNRVHSSPAIVDGKVFFGSFNMKVYALNLTSGTSLWQYTTGASIRTSPSVVDGRVFIASSSTVYCLNATNGGYIWSYTTGGSIYSSPAVAYGNVYIGSNDYKMYCLNAENGALKWSFITEREIYSSPAIAQNKTLFGSFDNNVYSLNAATGTMAWCYQTAATNCRIYSSPAVANNTVFIAYSYGTFFARLIAFKTPNQPPIAGNLTITPSSPFTTDNLTANYDYSDPDGDAEYGTEVRWYKNTLLQSDYNDKLLVPYYATSRGESWYFTVRPKDNEAYGELQTSPAVTIQNSPPIIAGVTITPNPAYTDTDLTAASYGWYDADGDSAEYTFQWQKWGGAAWQNITGATSNTLTSNYFVKDDQIKAICTPYDGIDYGISKENTTIISNTPPTIVSHYPSVNPVILEGESQEFNITKFDIDDDLLNVIWWINQSDTGETSDSYTYTADYESAGVYNITVVVSDGLEETFYEWVLTVIDVNRPPTIDSYHPLTNLTINEGTSQEFNVTYSDLDGDFVIVQWYLNGTPTVTTDFYIFVANYGSSGIYNITVVISDGELFDSQKWMLTVVFGGIHDVAVTNVTTSKTGCIPMETVGKGFNVTVIAIIENQGDFIENFNITVYANSTIIGSKSVTLVQMENVTLIFTWNTTSFYYGNYTISVTADRLSNETDTVDNLFTYGKILVTIPSDIDGNTYSNIKDAVLVGMAFGSARGEPSYNPNADINNDGYINIKDAVILGIHFGQQWE